MWLSVNDTFGNTMLCKAIIDKWRVACFQWEGSYSRAPHSAVSISNLTNRTKEGIFTKYVACCSFVSQEAGSWRREDRSRRTLSACWRTSTERGTTARVSRSTSRMTTSAGTPPTGASLPRRRWCTTLSCLLPRASSLSHSSTTSIRSRCGSATLHVLPKDLVYTIDLLVYYRYCSCHTPIFFLCMTLGHVCKFVPFLWRNSTGAQWSWQL